MTNLSWKVYFNKIYIIESLRAEDRKTGRELSEDSLHYALMAANNDAAGKEVKLSSEYHFVESGNDFTKILDKVLSECISDGVGPVLHLEIHGSKSGLRFADDSIIEWNEIANRLLMINVASHFNLFLTLAVCFGGHLIRIVRPMTPVPFWGFVGAIQSIDEKTIAEGFSEFYASLLIGKSANAALQSLNTVASRSGIQFSLVNAFKVFLYFFKKVYSNEGIKQAVDGLLKIQSKKMLRELRRRHGKHNVRRYIKEQVYTPELKNRYMTKVLSKTFMWDKVPENKDRFNMTYEELMQIKEDFHYFW